MNKSRFYISSIIFYLRILLIFAKEDANNNNAVAIAKRRPKGKKFVTIDYQ